MSLSPPSTATSQAPALRSLARERSLFLLGLVAFGAVISLRKLGDFDLPWHLALGRAVVALRAIPKLDPLAYTHQRVRFIEPLSELPLYALWRSGGALSLQIAGGLIAVGIGYLLFRLLRHTGPFAYAVSALSLAAINSWLVVRPATLSFLLIALVLGLIELHRQALSAKIRQRVLWCLPPLMLGWASAHGFAFIGGGLCIVYAAYRGGCWAARGRLGAVLPEQDGRDAGPTALAACLALLGAMLNAAGPTARLGPSRFAGDAVTRLEIERVTESVSPSLGFYVQHAPLAALVLVLAVCALFFGRDRTGKRVAPTAFELALVLLGLLGFVWMVRSVPLGVLLMAPVIGLRLGAAVSATPVTRWALATSPYLAAGYALLDPAMNLGVGFDQTHFSDRACEYIVKHDVRGHMFNFSPLGGYLALKLGPERLVFVDGRGTNAREGALSVRADQANENAAVFAGLVEEFDMQYAVMSARDSDSFGIPLARSRDWALVHLDDVAAVYVRRQGPNAALAGAGYQMFRHLNDPSALLNLALQGGSAARPLQHDGQLAAAQDPNSARAAFFWACGELAARNHPGFISALQRLSALAPEHPAIRVLSESAQRLSAEPVAPP